MQLLDLLILYPHTLALYLLVKYPFAHKGNDEQKSHMRFFLICGVASLLFKVSGQAFSNIPSSEVVGLLMALSFHSILRYTLPKEVTFPSRIVHLIVHTLFIAVVGMIMWKFNMQSGREAMTDIFHLSTDVLLLIYLIYALSKQTWSIQKAEREWDKIYLSLAALFLTSSFVVHLLKWSNSILPATDNVTLLIFLLFPLVYIYRFDHLLRGRLMDGKAVSDPVRQSEDIDMKDKELVPGQESSNRELLGKIDNTEATSSVKKNQDTEISNPALEEAIWKLYKEQNAYLDSDWSMAKMANVLNINKTTLSLYLNREMQTSFYALNNEYRIDHAIKLIEKYPERSLSSIGYEVGYNTRSVFVNAFKKQMNCSPSEWKALNINAEVGNQTV